MLNWIATYQFFLGFFHEYEGILWYIHFKLLLFIMHFKYHSNWMEVYMAYSSPLFATLNFYSSASTRPWLESHADCLSDLVIIKNDNSKKHYIMCEGSCTLFICNIQSWWEIFMLKLACQSFISTGYFATSCTLPMPNFQESNSKSEIVFNLINP